MLQRIMIALSLANDPEVLIADEPTTALDVTIQAQIVALLKELQVRRRLSLIFISHDLGLVGQIADRILVMYGGIVLEIGPAREVLTAPCSPYTRALLRSLPSWGSHYSREALSTIPGGVPDPSQPEPGCPFAPRCPLLRDECVREIPPMQSTDRELQSPAAAGGLLPRQSDAGGAFAAEGEPRYDPGGVESHPDRAHEYRCVVPGVKS
jgi:oligopeptide/dipeptide ABC transporter ATP-binding protein